AQWADYRQRFPNLTEPIGEWLEGEGLGVANSRPLYSKTGEVPELPVDSVVDDFHLLKLLGQGAFARVYLSKQLSMQRLVALKVSRQGSDEPRALSQLDHANIVRVYDQREITQPIAILLYMQYVAGGTLADCIKQVRDMPVAQRTGAQLLASIDQNLLCANQSLPEQSVTRTLLSSMDWPRVVAWLGIQLAQGLGYAAGKGVLHRDVKPANILLSSDGVPKLADFNVSCSGLSGRAGAAAYFGGSLAYMSPEQLRVADPTDPLTADQLDGRSDLYSLGMVLWELWQGERPWVLADLASNWTEAVQMQLEIRSSSFSPNCSSQTATERVLEKVLRSLLSVDPSARPQTGQGTAARLQLAFEPELAARFEPAPRSLSGWLLKIPVLLLAGLIVFGPNTVASIFNYGYNYRRMAQWHEDPSMLSDFIYVSQWVNGVVFPLGIILFLIFTLP
ncbi:MAG: serine/threonine protein kinase, partial [Planctomycetales bacterium]|nr:serine/threonine protein kinase [Planctomycetales bacterium]